MNEQEYEECLELFRISFIKKCYIESYVEEIKKWDKEDLEIAVFKQRYHHYPQTFYSLHHIPDRHVDAIEQKYKDWLSEERIEEMMQKQEDKIKERQAAFDLIGVERGIFSVYHLYQILKKVREEKKIKIKDGTQ